MDARQLSDAAQPDETPQPKLAVELSLLFILAILWGSSYTLIKIAVETIPPLTIVAARVSIATVLLAIVARHRQLAFPVSASVWGTLVIQASLLNAVPFTLITWGEQFIDSGLAGILNATPPVFVFLITLLWTRHEPATPQNLFGVLCGIGGVIVIVGADALRGLGQHTLGQLAVTGASICYAFAAINGRRLTQCSPIVTAAGTMLCAALLMVPLSVAVDRPWTASPSWTSLVAVGSLAILSTAVATMIYYRLLSSLGSIGTTSNSYLRAVVSVLLGATVLGERPGWSAGGGLLLVAVGVAAINGQLASLWPSANGGASHDRPS